MIQHFTQWLGTIPLFGDSLIIPVYYNTIYYNHLRLYLWLSVNDYLFNHTIKPQQSKSPAYVHTLEKLAWLQFKFYNNTPYYLEAMYSIKEFHR